MPNIKSAKKRVLIEKRNNARNRSEMTAVKTAIKKINNAIDTDRIDEAEKMLPEVMSVIDSAVTKGIIHKNNAANKRIADIKSGKLVVEIKKDNKTLAAEKAKAAKEAREAAKAAFAQKQAEAAALAAQAKKEAEEKEKAEKKTRKKSKKEEA